MTEVVEAGMMSRLRVRFELRAHRAEVENVAGWTGEETVQEVPCAFSHKTFVHISQHVFNDGEDAAMAAALNAYYLINFLFS